MGVVKDKASNNRSRLTSSFHQKVQSWIFRKIPISMDKENYSQVACNWAHTALKNNPLEGDCR